MYAAAYEHTGLTDQPALRAASNAERINSPAIPRPPIAGGTRVWVMFITPSATV